MAFQCSDKAWHLQVDYCFQLVVRHRHRCRPRIETGRETGKEGERERGREEERGRGRVLEMVKQSMKQSTVVGAMGSTTPVNVVSRKIRVMHVRKLATSPALVAVKNIGKQNSEIQPLLLKKLSTIFRLHEVFRKKIIHYIPIT